MLGPNSNSVKWLVSRGFYDYIYLTTIKCHTAPSSVKILQSLSVFSGAIRALLGVLPDEFQQVVNTILLIGCTGIHQWFLYTRLLYE